MDEIDRWENEGGAAVAGRAPHWYTRMVGPADMAPDICEVCEEEPADPAISRRTSMVLGVDCSASAVADGIIDRDGNPAA